MITAETFKLLNIIMLFIARQTVLKRSSTTTVTVHRCWARFTFTLRFKSIAVIYLQLTTNHSLFQFKDTSNFAIFCRYTNLLMIWD